MNAIKPHKARLPDKCALKAAIKSKNLKKERTNFQAIESTHQRLRQRRPNDNEAMLSIARFKRGTRYPCLRAVSTARGHGCHF